MKLATYNIWNSNNGMPKRLEQLIEEIKRVDVDVLCLQEVSKERLKMILSQTDYKYHFAADQEGVVGQLAVLSKHPIALSAEEKYALITVIEYEGLRLALANVHLPYDSALERESEIIEIESKIVGLNANFKFIIGDYNCSETSSVYKFLTSDMTLNGNECHIYWIDLASVAEERYDIPREMTLDLMNNPRWKKGSVCDCSARVDLIFMHDCFPMDYPTMNTFTYFGKSVSHETGLSPSDHYGVMVDLSFTGL